MMKPVLVLDFDSVIYSGTSGWKGAHILPDTPKPGAMTFIAAAVEHFHVDIFSGRRSETALARRAMWLYVKEHLEEAIGDDKSSRIISMIDFPVSKPTPSMCLDGRAVVDGSWPTIEALLALKEHI